MPGCTFSGLVASSMLTSPEKANTALHANELLEALKSPGVNGGVFNLTYVWNCINQASPGSADDFARRLHGHILDLKPECKPTLAAYTLASYHESH